MAKYRHHAWYALTSAPREAVEQTARP